MKELTEYQINNTNSLIKYFNQRIKRHQLLSDKLIVWMLEFMQNNDIDTSKFPLLGSKEINKAMEETKNELIAYYNGDYGHCTTIPFIEFEKINSER